MIFPEKLKKGLREKLLSLEDKSFDKSLFIDENILNTMCEVSDKSGYEVSLIIDRKGKIVDIACGDKNSATHSIEVENKLGYSGLRLIHTHPNASSNLSQMDLSFLRNKRLDLICAVSIKDGVAYDAQVHI